jgi:hypothetical protein
MPIWAEGGKNRSSSLIGCPVRKLSEGEGSSLSYAKQESIESGLRFKTRGGLVVETTGVTQTLEANDDFVHEVVIVEGEGEGNKYLHNLDYAEKV